MRKPFPFNAVDTLHRCIDCGQPMKKNLLAHRPDAKRCYTCHKLSVNAGKLNTNVNLSRLKAKQEEKINGGQSD